MSIQTQALDALKQLNEQMYALYTSNTAVVNALGLPIPVQIVAAQQGGVLALASGGRVPAMLEPGEMVFPGPLSSRTLGTLQTVNHTFPRFQVGGMGDGDTVPAMLLAGSFVLNRRAAGTMQAQGYQMGGSVSGGNSAKS